MKELKKKIGPLELWQWIAIVGGSALAFYLYERKKSNSGVSPEEEEKLLAGLSRGGGGGGGEGSVGGGGVTATAPAAEGPKGEAGPVGPTGNTGPQGEAPSAGLERNVESLQANQLALEQRLNHPQTQSHIGAPQKLGKNEGKNAKGERYKVETKGNGIFHVYLGKNGKPSRILKVGEVHKKAPPKKRPKPKPIAKHVTVKHVKPKAEAHHVKKKEPKKR